MEVQSTLLDKIREAQKYNKEIAKIKEKMGKGKGLGSKEQSRLEPVSHNGNPGRRGLGFS